MQGPCISLGRFLFQFRVIDRALLYFHSVMHAFYIINRFLYRVLKYCTILSVATPFIDDPSKGASLWI